MQLFLRCCVTHPGWPFWGKLGWWLSDDAGPARLRRDPSTAKTEHLSGPPEIANQISWPRPPEFRSWR
jgi:hypothetical protein